MLKAFPLIEDFTTSVSEYLDEISDVYSPEVKHWVMQRGIKAFGSGNQNVLQHFFEHPWFLRSWVFQEAVCAKVAVVQCGFLRLDFKILELFAVMIHVNGLITMLSTEESRSAHHQLYTIRNARRFYARGEKHTLFQLRIASSPTGAKDPRDQLFSLAGISAGQPLPYAPNYAVDVLTWYRDFSAHAMQTEPGLEILAKCFLQPQRLSDLPSWAHDWTASRYVPYHGNEPSRIFSADSNSGPVQKLSFNSNRLTLTGYIIDEIAQVGSERYPQILANINESQTEARQRRAEALIEMIVEIVTLARDIPQYSNGSSETLWQALWRTLLGDQRLQQNLQNVRIDPSYEQIVAHLKPLVTGNEGACDINLLLDPSADEMETFRSIYRVSFQRCFCTTQSGRLGWVPRYTQKGDAVAIIPGIGIPMILRPKMTYHEVVGSSYVYGIMDGEMADGDRLAKELLHHI